MNMKTIIIIGATSGIGRALFEKYAAEGNCMGIVGRRTYLLDELLQEHPDTTFSATADITRQEEIEQAIHTLCAKLENIDLAIVCSGTGDLNPSLDYALELPTIDTNVKGWTFVIDTLYHIFEQQGYGHLVAITSVGGIRGGSMALPIVRLKPTRLTTWKLCERRHTRVAAIFTSPTFDLVSLILLWQKAMVCFG